MSESRRWGLADLAALLLVLGLAAGSRFWYIAVAADGGEGTPALEVQGSRISALPPLADKEEKTADVSPAYPWLISLVSRWDVSVDGAVRWAQAALGTLTVACYFCFARRAFQSLLVGFLAGLLAALHPFWIINTAELADGVLASFLLAMSLALGTRASQSGGAFASLLYGLALAGLAMTRAALLPFAVVALIWFLVRCRDLRAGWFCALLAVLGFGNGLAPWTVRNYREFGESIPIVDSAMLHLWMGNNPRATGGWLDEKSLRASLPPARVQALLAEPNQARRYAALGEDVVEEVTNDPTAAIGRRLWAGLLFVFGENWFKHNNLGQSTSGDDIVTPPPWVSEGGEGALRASLLVMLILGLLGWRFSFGWRKQARLATLALIWGPLPYLLTHADFLSGPRLPLDGVLLCFAAFALACCLPGVRRGPQPAKVLR